MRNDNHKFISRNFVPLDQWMRHRSKNTTQMVIAVSGFGLAISIIAYIFGEVGIGSSIGIFLCASCLSQWWKSAEDQRAIEVWAETINSMTDGAEKPSGIYSGLTLEKLEIFPTDVKIIFNAWVRGRSSKMVRIDLEGITNLKYRWQKGEIQRAARMMGVVNHANEWTPLPDSVYEIFDSWSSGRGDEDEHGDSGVGGSESE